jgi:hypothetical protein
MFPEFCKWKTKLTENSKFRLFFCKQKMEMANFCWFAAN